MRISTTIVSVLVAAGSLSLASQQAIEEARTAAPALDLVPLPSPDTSEPTDAQSAQESAPADEAQTTEPATELASEANPEQTPTTDPAQTPTESAAPTTQTRATADSGQTTAEAPPATAEPAPATSAPAEPAPAAAPVAKTVTSDAINYKYGVVQISLTAVGTDVTKVTLLQGDTSYGRDVAYIALAEATVQTDGINYGNVSGATFTTDAFKKAVTNALGKL